MPNGATLPVAFEEAYNAGCRDIRVLRMSGSPAKAVIEGEEKVTTVSKIYEEVLGFVKGNAETVLRLVKNFVFPFHSAYCRAVIYCNYIF
ncbi:hypothetical protein [Caldicellulosiruptor changbaiensis]|uniref:hypothetical protein n=1 Tax=Caldicellulosiruptor changbaiensis TaxID=1222016 RepID=UPI0013DF7C39|nr:hypothetical protein [Caldicellulosiruptor changbaiensis]